MRVGAGKGSTISQAIVFLLLGIFAVFSTLLVLLSAQMYRSVVDHTGELSEQRILNSYILNVIKGNDMADAVSVEMREGIEVLVFGVDVDDERYETLIYCYEGKLRELFSTAAQEFEPEYGEMICDMQAFSPTLLDGLLCVRVVDAQMRENVLHVALRCGKEATDE